MDFKFSTGDTIELEVDNAKGINKYKTLIETWDGDVRFIMYAPIQSGSVVLLHVGERVKVFFSKYNSGANRYEVFSFMSRIETREIREGIAMITICRTGEIKKVQRRDYFRLNYVKNMMVHVIDEKEDFEVLTKDVSVGGMRFVSKKKLKQGEKVICHLAFETHPIISVKGEVVACDLLPDSQFKNDVRIRFINVKKALRSEMIKQINGIQSDYLKRLTNSKYEEHMDSVMAPININKLEQYNDDVQFDAKLGYFKGLLGLLSIIMMTRFIFSRPNSAYPVARFFNIVYQSSWKVTVLYSNIGLASVIILLCILGIFISKRHYGARKPLDKLFLSLIVFNAVFIMIILGVTTRLAL